MIFFFVCKCFQIKNGEKKWMVLKNQKCITPVKGAIEIEATFVYTNVKFFFLNEIFFYCLGFLA